MGILHDSAFRELFAHPESVRELVASFMPQDWAEQLDLASLERVNGSYVTCDGTQRHSDMVWRVLLAGHWLYLYLLLEFQSAPDPWMALRMRVYSALLHQDLIKRHELPTPGFLPPILPIVLYTGQKPWRAVRNLAELVMPGLDGVMQMAAKDEYLLLDIPRLLSEAEDQPMQPLAALLGMRYLPSRQLDRGVLGIIGQWLRESKSEELRGTVMAWIQSSLPGTLAESKLNPEAEKEHEMLIMRLRTPDFETAEDLWRYDTAMSGMERVLTQQLQQKFGEIPKDYGRRLGIAIDKDFKMYAARILDAKTIVEVFEPDPAEDE